MGKWEMVRLGDVIVYEQPTKYIVQNTDYSEAYCTPVLTAGQSFILGYTNEEYNIFKDNLPVIIFDDFTTAIKYVDFPFKVKSSAMKILKARKDASIRYLFYCMSRVRIDTELHKRYWISMYSNIQIPLPPLPIQQKIADVLDRASALIEKRKTQIEKLDLLIRSQFIKMFGDPVTNPMGWEKTLLSDITSSRLGKMLDGKKQTGLYAFPYLANFNVKWFEFDLKKLNYMDFDLKDQNEYSLSYGDLLICEGGEVGRCAVWKGNINKCFFQKAIHRVRCNPSKCNSFYLQYAFYFRAKKTQFRDTVGTATIPHLTGVQLRKLSFPLPPVTLQNKFASFTERVEEQKTQLKKSLGLLELNYKSLMQKCFNGDIL
ncbi:MAG: restriction endonuclease subunit S [Synergistaceae bacterium]|nr:restriction endonuclease subunit S [Synergistaceae bacterium]